MSFSKDIKQEIMSTNITEDCCALAFLSGLINSSGSFNFPKIDDKFNLTINTDLLELGEYINNIVSSLYKDKISLQAKNCFGINHAVYYKIEFPEDLAKRILFDTGIVTTLQGQVQKNTNIDEYLIKSECCLKSFSKAVFLGCGTTNIKINKEDRKTTGYHVEFASKNQEFLQDFAKVLTEFEIKAKLVQRKSTFVLYVKDANEVSNVLALVGASNAVLALQNEMATREVRNKVNRQTNCMSANINKTVEASLRQLEAIETIIDKVGLDTLDMDLQTVALLRLANTEESLEELLKLSKLPLTKSGLNHRFQKLIKIANKLK